MPFQHPHPVTMSSGAGVLRLDTDLGSKQDHATAHCIPTPISATGDERRSSISSWSFVGQPSSDSSQPSSASSFASCPEPSTPEHHGLPLEYPSFSSASSFETLANTPETLGHRSSFHASSGVESSPSMMQTGMSYQDSQWTMVARPFTSNVYVLPSHRTNGLMPACGDFSSSMAASLMTSPSHFIQPECASQQSCWSSSPYIPHYPSFSQSQIHESDQRSASGRESIFSWSVPIRNILPSSSNHDGRTVVPSEAMPAGFDYTAIDAKTSVGMDTSSFALPSPMKSEPDEYFDQGYIPMAYDSEDDKDAVLLKSGVLVPSNSSRRSKRPRSRRSGMLNRCRTGRIEHRLSDGRIIQCDKTVEKNQVCSYIFEKSGDRCGKMFARQEHLKRHEKTHTGEQEYYCPLPAHRGCYKSLGFQRIDVASGKCEDKKKFSPLGRKDNWRDHIKTHLRPSKSKRNYHCPNEEEMWEAIRQQAEEEEEIYGKAEDTIAMVKQALEKAAAEAAAKLQC